MGKTPRPTLMASGMICCAALSAAAQGLTGTDVAQGRNPDGSAYSGTVQIIQSASAVSMAWRAGASSYIGTGVQDGRVLTVNWSADHPVVYVLMADGSLHGTWDAGRALERLLPNWSGHRSQTKAMTLAAGISQGRRAPPRVVSYQFRLM